MKKIIYLFSAITLFYVQIKAQNAIPNGNFESWTSGSYDVPQFYWNSNAQTFMQCSNSFNCLKVANPYHGNYAIQLNTIATGQDTCIAYVVNSNGTGGGNPCNWKGGQAYNKMPTGIRGYYKNNSVANDSGGILITFKSGVTCLGLYMYKFGGVHNTYTPFQFTFSPALAGTPDTMIFAAVSSDVFNNVQKPGNMLQLDSISFVGATQPTNFNGDFELWQSQNIETPNNWYVSGGNGQGTNGVLKTTDMKAGSYAIELQTYLGSKGNNNTPAAQGAYISTGYYPNNCGSNCVQRGGHAFNNQIDTLEFYYKYAPANNDTAQANLQFKKNFTNAFSTGMNIYTPASTYQYVKMPFNTNTPIDTVIVSFQSTTWRDSAITFVGSVLKVDEAHFASQPLNTGIKIFDPSIGIKIFPNPSNDGNFMVSNVQQFDLVRVLNVYGQEVNAVITKENGAAKIQIANAGAYFVYVNARGKITTQKVIVTRE